VRPSRTQRTVSTSAANAASFSGAGNSWSGPMPNPSIGFDGSRSDLDVA